MRLGIIVYFVISTIGLETIQGMAVITPFNGIYYNAGRIGSLNKVIGPPYDVISCEEQKALYDLHPNNYVRVMLNRPEANDNETDNQYTRARAYLDEWLADGVLTQDAVPSLYVYKQSFINPENGARLERTALVVALKLEPYGRGVVLPHEETRSKAKEDRFRLMQATSSNPEPIFGLYEDPEGFTTALMNCQTATTPLLTASIGSDDHRLWRISEPETLFMLSSCFSDRRIWIADGHHRYETALAYRDYLEEKGVIQPGMRHSADYILTALVPFTDPGIVVLPTHRLVDSDHTPSLAEIESRLSSTFSVQRVDTTELSERMQIDNGKGSHKFGLVTVEGAAVLTLIDESAMESEDSTHSAVWKRLDVSILHTLILPKAFESSDIQYTRDRNEAMMLAQTGRYGAAFLLNTPSANEVLTTADAGEKMPAKSTFFYPKLWSGLLLRRLDHELAPTSMTD